MLTLTSWNLESLDTAVSDVRRKKKHLCGQEYDVLTFTSRNWRKEVCNFEPSPTGTKKAQVEIQV
jgi:hypothetical protein